MGTSYAPLDYGTSDPRKIASQQRQTIAQQGAGLRDQDQTQYNQYSDLRNQTTNYLGGIENPLAEGEGGYNAKELSQIELTPEEQQQMVTSAGVSAGTGTAAAVNAAKRAAAAGGGSPLALAAYRARAAQQEGTQSADAMTNARVAASNAAAGREENIGTARMGQQNQALSYLGGLQSEYNQNAENAQNRQQQEYATETSGGNQAGDIGLKASQTPSTFDKVMGGIGGALSFLADGDVIPGGETPAVVGDNGPEKVVTLGDPNGARKGPATSINPDGSINFTPGPAPAVPPSNAPGFWNRLGGQVMSNLRARQQPMASAVARQPQRPGSRDWSPVDTYSTIGSGAGKIASVFLEDGGIMPANHGHHHVRQGSNGIFTKPTRVNLSPGEAVVPLNYRPGAKTRPSMAAMPAAKQRRNYGGFGG